MIKRVTCFIMIICLLIGCSACKKNVSDSSSAPPQNLQTTAHTPQLIYCFSDSFNPYTSSTDINRQLCKLLFDPLIRLDNNFQPVNCLAQSVSVDGKECTVILKNVLFTDGSSVTASDVVDSYKLAKSSPQIYASQMYEVVSVTAVDAHTIKFQLSRNDPYFVNLLDFPIVKSGTDTRTDSDSVPLPPIGSGRYILSENMDSLMRNKGYWADNFGPEKIMLVNAPDKESVSHYVEIGATDVYYADLADGNIVRMSGKKTDINLNHFVYVGLNGNLQPLQIPEIRYAISTAINRSVICQSAYYNNALPANGFYHPAFSDTKAVQNIKNVSDPEIVVENLEKIGYNKLNTDGFRVNEAGAHLQFTLLVNSENASRVAAAQLIVKQMKAVGIQLTLQQLPYDQYLAALQAGQFQLYLGEIAVLNNMDLCPLVLQGGSTAFGVTAPTVVNPETSTDDSDPAQQAPAVPAVAEMMNSFYAGTAGIADVATALLTELPVIPVCYRKGLLFYHKEFGNLSIASQSDIFYSLGNKSK